MVYQIWNSGIVYSKLISAEGVPSSERLVNTGGNIDISQILADGSRLGTEQGGQSALWRIDLQSALREPEKIQTIPWTDRLLHVSPDGRFLAFATNRNGATQVRVSRLDGTQPRTLVSSVPPFGSYGDSTRVAGISWSPDGKWIALLTEPGVGHGVDDGRLFLGRATGGRLRVLVEPLFTSPGFYAMVGRQPIRLHLEGRRTLQGQLPSGRHFEWDANPGTGATCLPPWPDGPAARC